ncbi:MAG: type II toxin-antitoxin system HicB family antitoxin, partial [Candidatus Aminicenantia bacterium]
MAKEAIELYIESLKEHGEEIPTEEGTLEYTLTVEVHA